MALRNVLLRQDVETSVDYKIVNDRGIEKNRQRGVKLTGGMIYAIDDDAAVDRLLSLGYGEITTTAGVAPD